MDALGKRLIKSLLVEKNWGVLLDNHVEAVDLLGDARNAFLWIDNFYRTSGEWPTERMVVESTGISFPEDLDPLSYIADIIRKRSLSRSLETTLRVAVSHIESREPDEALRVLADVSRVCKDKARTARIVSHRASADLRIAAYDKVRKSGGFSGLRTPWPTLNKSIQGWVNGTLNVITAMANTGKTWFAVIIAEAALREGKKVLFVTLEMATPRIQRRIDSLRHKIPFEFLRDALMDIELESKWVRLLKEDTSGDGDILLADKKSVHRVSDVVALVSEYSPDLVIVDGGYRFEGQDRGKGQWESTVSIVNDLQLAAEMTDIPWIVTTQQGDSTETGKEVKTGPKMRMWGIRYGKEWVINPDTVIGLFRDGDSKLLKQAEVHLLKVRDGAGEDSGPFFKIWWDQTTMTYSEILEEFPESMRFIPTGHEVPFE
jgi:hypothetical protein